MVPTNHVIEYEEDGAGYGWRCSCRAVGGWFDTPPEASDDALEHIYDAGGDEGESRQPWWRRLAGFLGGRNDRDDDDQGGPGPGFYTIISS